MSSCPTSILPQREEVTASSPLSSQLLLSSCFSNCFSSFSSSSQPSTGGHRKKLCRKKLGKTCLLEILCILGTREGEWKGRKEKRKKKVNVLVPRKRKKHSKSDSTLLILTIQVGHQEFREVGERKVASRQALLSFWHPSIPERGETLGRVHPRGLPQVQDGAEPEGPRLVPLWQACAQHQRR